MDKQEGNQDMANGKAARKPGYGDDKQCRKRRVEMNI